jgi:kinetochore protein NDC80
MVSRLNTLEQEIENDDSRCTADARQMKNELERKEHLLSPVEKEAADFLKVLLTFIIL